MPWREIMDVCSEKETEDLITRRQKIVFLLINLMVEKVTTWFKRINCHETSFHYFKRFQVKELHDVGLISRNLKSLPHSPLLGNTNVYCCIRKSLFTFSVMISTYILVLFFFALPALYASCLLFSGFSTIN
jgi:hypothetical protein